MDVLLELAVIYCSKQVSYQTESRCIFQMIEILTSMRTVQNQRIWMLAATGRDMDCDIRIRGHRRHWCLSLYAHLL